MYKDYSFLAAMGEWGEIRHSTATGGRIKWLQKKWLSCLLLSTIYFLSFCCDGCWIPPWRGEGSCFVCAGSEIHHCSLFSAGSMCEHESCALIPALHPLCIPSELALKPPLLYPTLWVFALPWHYCLCCCLLLPPWRPSLPFIAANIHASREKSALPVHWLVQGAMIQLCSIWMLTQCFPYINAHMFVLHSPLRSVKASEIIKCLC